jgi:hypothetical protein
VSLHEPLTAAGAPRSGSAPPCPGSARAGLRPLGPTQRDGPGSIRSTAWRAIGSLGAVAVSGAWPHVLHQSVTRCTSRETRESVTGVLVADSSRRGLSGV